MFKKILVWLQGMLGLGYPAILSMASLLTGEGGDDSKGPSLTPLIAASRKLWEAEIHLQKGRYSEAKVHLKQADELMRRLTPHTPDFESLSTIKRNLWEKVTRHSPPWEDRK